MAKKSIIWKEGQSIFDIAFICYGDSSYAFKVLEENPSLAQIGNGQWVGKTIEYTEPTNNDNLRRLGLVGLKPNTGDIEETLPSGYSGYLITHVPEYVITHASQKILIQP